jgi:tetratricopeptide (TPR) repeat protein
MQKAATAISRKKSLAFKLIAVLLPFVFLALLEVILRLSGYGHDLSLFVADKANPGFLVMNKYVSERYFTQGVNATIGNSEIFRAKKAKGVTRIFVLGESTTIGYPYMHNGSFHRWLQYRLLNMYPDADFELINLSLTAVNSYTVLDMAKELKNYEPDAVLIYTGHNEYYGALGVGSTSRLGNSPWAIQTLMRLKELRVVQLIFNAAGSGKSKAIKTDKTLMERMAADQHIPYQSIKFKNGIKQFADNMDAACSLLSGQKIPVFISNLVSNSKDLKPLASNAAEGDSSANSQYKKAVVALSNGDKSLAVKLFTGAKEHDELRFRAPEQINTAINNIAKKYPGVYLVNTSEIFEKHSAQGIIGGETILEHVHPNLLGYALMSEAFYQSLRLHHVLPAKPFATISLAQLRRDMPVTGVDSLFGVYSVMQLKKGWPFNQDTIKLPEPTTEEGGIAMKMLTAGLPWNEAMDQLMNYYQEADNSNRALKVAEAVMLEYPQDATFYVFAGRICAQQNRLAKAENYLARAFKITPSLELASALYAVEIKAEQPEKAALYVDYALKTASSSTKLLRIKERLSALMILKEKLKMHPADTSLRGQLAQGYNALKNQGNAAN